MLIGLPREIKSDEYRVAMLPSGVEDLTQSGHRVLVERGAGAGSGIADEDYAACGAEIVRSHADVFAADVVIKVKEPLAPEWPLLRRGQVLFTYFHFAADEELTRNVLESGVTAVAYETLKGRSGDLPLLTPMSEVAGRMSIQQGARFLERPQEGRGILLGGVPGVEPAHIAILGGGVVGKNAARIDNIREQLRKADLIIGGVLIPGARAPRLVTAEDLKIMKPGAVVIDVCIDQGGCFETSRPTTHSAPTYLVDGILHYCVTNMPGAVGRTSTYALCNVTFPYLKRIVSEGLQAACQRDPGLAAAVNMLEGRVTNQAVAETFGLKLGSL